MDKQIIRSIRKGSVQWNEDDRITLATLLIKCGYTARITHRAMPGYEEKKNGKTEYVIEFWEE